MLGAKSEYKSEYDPSLLFPIPRSEKRNEIHVPQPLPFHGVDIWNAFELSWLNPKGKPHVAIAEIQVPCTSPNIVESKSLKLYLNSYNQTKIKTGGHVKKLLEKDLCHTVGAPVAVKLILPKEWPQLQFNEFTSACIDHLEVSIETYITKPNLLAAYPEKTKETLHSHLLKSNCPVTNQPDWASIQIHYQGPKIDHASLLKYLASFRQHQEFHEQCIERIFMDILTQCKPEKLTVYGRYTRRGGIDINPFRSNFEPQPINNRLCRQ